jgi:hypothetical protein
VARLRWILLATLLGALAGAAPAVGLPVNPWNGTWAIPKADIPCNDRPALGVTGDQIFTAVQTGSRVTFTYAFPGGQSGTISGNVSPDGSVFTAGAAPDGWTETSPAYCFGTGHAMVQLQMAADARSFTTVPGAASQTDFGNPVSISGTRGGGSTSPVTCPGGEWTGLWGDPSSPLTLVQTGQRVNGTYPQNFAGRPGGTLVGVVSGETLTGTFQDSGGSGTFSYAFDATTRTWSGTQTGGGVTVANTGSFLGCPPPPPNLQSTIPSPQQLTSGPTSLVAPGRLSLRSLRRSKCVLVRVATKRPARILVSIFSGRLSIRLFGQRLVVFRTAPAQRQVCIAVPFRARTFNVRTPLRVALGYTAGAKPQRTGPKPKPVIKPITLVP